MLDNDFDVAYRKLLDAAQSEPDNGQAWLRLADFLSDESSSPHLALRAYREAASLLPDHDLRLSIGSTMADIGDYANACELIQEYINDGPDAIGYCMLGSVHYDAEMYVEAGVALRHAIDCDPQYDEAYYLLGEIERKGGRDNVAIDFYRQAIDLDDTDTRYWEGLGTSLLHNPETVEEGVEALEVSLRCNPDNVWARCLLGNGLWRSGKLLEAKATFETVVRECPEEPAFGVALQQFLNANPQMH